MPFRFKPGEIVTFYFDDGTAIGARVIYTVIGEGGKLTPEFYTPDGVLIWPVDVETGLYKLGDTLRHVTLAPAS